LIRGEVSKENNMIVSYDDSENIIEFVNSKDAYKLSQVGAACPDHLVHTKQTPLFIDWDPQNNNMHMLVDRIRTGISDFEIAYVDYFNRNKSESDNMFEPVPRVILI